MNDPLRDRAAYMRSYRAGKGKKNYEDDKKRTRARDAALRKLARLYPMQFNRIFHEEMKNQGLIPPQGGCPEEG